VTRDQARMQACKLLLEASKAITEIDEAAYTPRTGYLIGEIILCWKHVRDMEVGEQHRPPDGIRTRADALAKFEAWARPRGFVLKTNISGQYEQPFTCEAWEIWNAAINATLEGT
jgi:hypothetical protein